METTRTFNKGMNQDSTPLRQPDDTYREAYNFVQFSKDGNFYALTNEQGTIDRTTEFPEGFKVMGYVVLNQDVIVALAHDNGYSQIGVISHNGTYTRACPRADEDDTDANTNTELGLDTANPVDMAARDRVAGDRYAYWCNGVGNIPMSFVNLDDAPVIGEIKDNTKVIPNQNIPIVTLQSVEELSGNLRCGKYHFMLRYYTEDLTPTTYNLPCSGIDIVDDYTNVGRDNYDGELPDSGAVNKAILLDLNNVDTSFPYLEVIVVRYSGISHTFTAEALPLVDITSETMEFSYSGNETDITNVTQAELNLQPISYSSAKAVVQKDNVLFWSNLADNSNRYDELFQQFANSVTVKYKINEIVYKPTDRETEYNGLYEGGGDLQSTYLLVEPYVYTQDGDDAPYYVVFQYSEDVSPASPSTFQITAGEVGASVFIDVETAAGMIDDTDVGISLTIEYDGVSITTTAVSDAGNTDDTLFDISTGDTRDIAENITNSINNQQSTVTFNATYSGSAIQIDTEDDGTDTNDATILFTTNDDSGSADTLTISDIYNNTATPDSAFNFAGGQGGATYTATSAAQVGDTPGEIIVGFDSTNDVPDGIQAGWAITGEVVNAQNETVILNEQINLSAGTNSGGASSGGDLNDYKSTQVVFGQRGYMRDEVYAFGVVFLFKDGSQSYNYPINGNNKTATETEPAITIGDGWSEATEGFLGTYVSDAIVPSDQSMPGTRDGDSTTAYGIDSSFTNIDDDAVLQTVASDNVRHFKMPDLDNEPHIRYSSADKNLYIRIIGLEFVFNTELIDSIQQDIQGVMITRQKRNSNEAKSIYAQGFVDRYCQVYNHYDYDFSYGSGGRDAPVWKKLPFWNCSDIVNEESNGSSGKSVAFEAATGDTPDGDTRQTSLELDPVNEHMAFWSPDSHFNLLNPNNAQAGFLTPVMKLTAGGTYSEIKKSKNNHEWRSPGFEWSFYRYFPQCWIYADFMEPSPRVATSQHSVVNSRYIAGGITTDVEGMLYPIDNTLSSRHMYIRVSGESADGTTNISDDVDSFFGFDDYQKWHHKTNNNYQASWDNWDVQSDNSDYLEGFGLSNTISNHLFNIQAINSEQYGDLGGATYIPVTVSVTPPTAAGQSISGVYGGDTFISRFSYKNYEIWKLRGPYRAPTEGLNYRNNSAFYHNDAFDKANGAGFDCKAVSYIFVESIVNCNYRHTYAEYDTNGDQVAIDQPYFPRDTIGNIFQALCTAGDTAGYNYQYSFENDVRTFQNKLAAQATIGSFPNRTIHSNTALEDELTDAYRLYQQNAFYDLPKHTGEIWDNFVYNNTLFLHTPKSLWRTYTTDVTQQATSAGEVVMGVGSIFAIPAKEMIVSTGGYAGSSSQWAGVVTPYAYFFPDVLQKKVFMLQGDQLREISQVGMQQWFFNNMAEGIVDEDTGVVADNPFTGTGLIGGYDFEKKRYLFGKKGTDSDVTISFSSLMECWVSFHDYQPSAWVSQNTDLYAFTNDDDAKMWQHNASDGQYGVYYDNDVASSSIDIVFNENILYDKTWDNMKLHTESYDNTTGVVQQFDTFTSLQAYTDTRNTGWYDMVVTNAYGSKAVDDPTTQVRVRRNNNKFNLTIPRDAVVDDGQNIFDTANLDPTGTFKPRVKGDHLTTQFIYDNANDYEFVLNFMAITYRANPS